MASAIQPRSDTSPETTGTEWPPGAREQRRARPIETVGDRRQPKAQVDLRPHDGEPLVRREMVEPIAQSGGCSPFRRARVFDVGEAGGLAQPWRAHGLLPFVAGTLRAGFQAKGGP